MITLPILVKPLPNQYFWEEHFWSQGFNFVAGLDEAGRGCLAGPVCAAAVILKPHTNMVGVDDSKKISAKKREELFDRICSESLAFAVAMVSVEEIDRINILQASLLAMKKAVSQLSILPQQLLIDGNQPVSLNIPQKTIIDGDALSASIGAASILAKVSRDRYMVDLEKECPGYLFFKHKGYGTKDHLLALEKHGPTRYHRSTFAPVARCLEKAARLA